LATSAEGLHRRLLVGSSNEESMAEFQKLQLPVAVSVLIRDLPANKNRQPES
jgi:hypothetical protein